MSKAHNGNDYERLKEELRRLKRRGAPWYFESALHQRLHGGRRRRPRLRPISVFPVLTVALLTLCISGLAVYVALMHTNLVFPGSHQGGSVPADTITGVPPGESLPPPPARGSAPAKGSPRGAARTLTPARAASDTAQPRLREEKPASGDSAVVRSDTAVRHADSSSHGVDTALSPGHF
jgi:hypothetical protein